MSSAILDLGLHRPSRSSPAERWLPVLMRQWREFLAREHLLYNVADRSHRCWETAGAIQRLDGHLPTAEQLDLWGCEQCGRTHMCRALAEPLENSRLERLAPDPCPLVSVPDGLHRVCGFSGRIVNSDGRDDVADYASFNDWEEHHDDGVVDPDEWDETGSTLSATRMAIERAQFTERQTARTHAFNSHRLGKHMHALKSQTRRLKRWRDEAEALGTTTTASAMEEPASTGEDTEAEEGDGNGRARRKRTNYIANRHVTRSAAVGGVKRSRIEQRQYNGDGRIIKRPFTHRYCRPTMRDILYYEWFCLVGTHTLRLRLDRAFREVPPPTPTDTTDTPATTTHPRRFTTWYRTERTYPSSVRTEQPPPVEETVSYQWLLALKELLLRMLEWVQTMTTGLPAPAPMDEYMDVMARWARLIWLKRPRFDIRPIEMIGVYFLDLALRDITVVDGIGTPRVLTYADPFAIALHERHILEVAFVGPTATHAAAMHNNGSVLRRQQRRIKNIRQQRAVRSAYAGHGLLADATVDASAVKRHLLTALLSDDTEAVPQKEVPRKRKAAVPQKETVPQPPETPVVFPTVAFAPEIRCTGRQIHQLKEVVSQILSDADHRGAWIMNWFHHDARQCWPLAAIQGYVAATPPPTS